MKGALPKAWNAVASESPSFDVLGPVLNAAELVKSAERELKRAIGAIEAARKAAWREVG